MMSLDKKARMIPFDLRCHVALHQRDVRLIAEKVVEVEVGCRRAAAGVEIQLGFGAKDEDPVLRLRAPLDVICNGDGFNEWASRVGVPDDLGRRSEEKPRRLTSQDRAAEGKAEKGGDCGSGGRG